MKLLTIFMFHPSFWWLNHVKSQALRPGPHSAPTASAHSQCQEKLDELEICQAAIFVAAMCGLEWLKDQAVRVGCEGKLDRFS